MYINQKSNKAMNNQNTVSIMSVVEKIGDKRKDNSTKENGITS